MNARIQLMLGGAMMSDFQDCPHPTALLRQNSYRWNLNFKPFSIHTHIAPFVGRYLYRYRPLEGFERKKQGTTGWLVDGRSLWSRRP